MALIHTAKLGYRILASKYVNMVVYVDPQGIEQEIDFADLVKTSTYTVLYFYPKDNTPGCTIEAKDFTELQPDFAKYKTQIIWVSKDSVKSHCGFQNKQWLTLGLISDTDTTLAQQFDARGEKKFMGRKYMGMFRNTYLLDKKGTIIYKRENVSAVWHAKNVLEYIQSL